MSKLLVKDKDMVMPGDIVAEGMDYLPTQGILREQEKLIASQIGTIHIFSTSPITMSSTLGI